MIRPVVALGFACLAGTARAQTTDVALGIEALARRDLKGAEAAFRRGTTAENPLIRPAAWQWLGHVAWKFRGDTTAAKRYLDRALTEARDSSQILLEIARLAGARRRFHEGVQIARDAMLRSVDAERRGGAARTLVTLAVDGAFANRRVLLRDSVDLRVIAEARDTIARRVTHFPGRMSDARALIEAAAMLGDSAGVRAGLRSYLALDPSFDQWYRYDTLVVEGLRRARLHEPIALFIRGSGLNRLTFELESEMVYADYLRDVRELAERGYRSELAGTARVGDFTRALNARGRRLWAELPRGGQAPGEYLPAALYRTLRGRFGTYVSVERGRGFDELYFSHIVLTHREDRGAVISLDDFISSGIDDWLLDGTGGRAGWVAGDTIYERRTGFTETPFRALLALTDPQTIPGELFRITRDSIGDIERARRDSVGYFPGVAARVFRSGAQALLDSLKTPDAFTRSMYDNLKHSSITLHEGRHRLDERAQPGQPQAEAEFRAKLDEVTGARLPRLAMTAILSPNIGDSSPHGQANRRIMIGLNRWIRRNGRSIAGYDPATPALLQLPSLTDAQLRAAFNSMRAR